MLPAPRSRGEPPRMRGRESHAAKLPDVRCAVCNEELPGTFPYCPFCGAAVAGPATARPRGAQGRDRPLRRPGRLHRPGRATRSRGRPCAARAVPRSPALGARALRRDGREVHRRCGDGAVRRAGRARGRSRAGGAGGARDPRLGGRAGRRAAGARSRSTPARRWSRSTRGRARARRWRRATSSTRRRGCRRRRR